MPTIAIYAKKKMATSIIKQPVGSGLGQPNVAPLASDTVETILTRDVIPATANLDNGVYTISNSWPNVIGGWTAMLAKVRLISTSNYSFMGFFGQYQKLYYFRTYVTPSNVISGDLYIHQITMTQVSPT